ncbi:MAG TPA: hypothetical protein DHU78_06690 [Opitutae bacterium]|nr:hypothetical protein [Opitutae bacterium]
MIQGVRFCFWIVIISGQRVFEAYPFVYPPIIFFEGEYGKFSFKPFKNLSYFSFKIFKLLSLCLIFAFD